jgi:hypothetical protein
MNRAATDNWSSSNQRYLTAALAVVREVLEQHAARSAGEMEAATGPSHAQQALHEAAESMSAPSALETLCRTFRLSPFERDVLLLSAGAELDSSFSRLCADAQGDPTRTYPTFSLALAALPDAHWSALTPAGPLRHWRLIELGAGSSLTLSPLRIDECVLHFLTGTPHLDERLVGLVEPLRAAGELVPSHAALAQRIAAAWSQASGRSALPVIQLCGDERPGKRAVAAAACAALGLGLNVMPAQFIPANASELEALIRLLGREAALSATALLVDCDELDTADAARAGAISRLIERTAGPLIVTSRERQPVLERLTITLDVSKPSAGEQRTVWQHALGEAAHQLNGQVDRLVTQFSLSTPTIHAACAEATTDDSPLNAHQLWDACRMQARPRLDNLAQRIEPAAGWDDLVLPAQQRETLRDIAAHVRHRATVYESWGFGSKGSRGLGISALFAGASGTGKTMAAEVLAGELRLDLYRIDLSAVVSKYIGETEKNLRRVFDAAEEGGAILLFDEADALFGKRSEVKDSHDRYANIEVSYLLQRMETYRGLAILTTNLKNALDTAFLRRIRFIVPFPFPDAAQRAEIWQRIFPADTPTDGLDVMKLSRLNVAGGHIRNIALSAAFLAAGANEPVRMPHLLRAARSEYAKLEKPLTESEIGGWT